ncbi:gag-pol polyprotein [Apostichopus japonicus]|uniref:Gag-pol polyprotein n=1 Tax=Stichopus japonicus TaxID=307972 RepID=A0A2G8KE58_STIJA|nr:gag-pol polyprotein [Apostichopus japonicus]
MQPLTDLLSSKVKNKSIQLTDAQHQSFKDIKTALAQKAETRYSAFGRELLAVYLSIRHFRHLLDGRSFTVYTDHKPLTYAFASKPDRYSPREIRHLDYISQYSTDLRHIPGRDNVVADALSRNVYGVTISSSPLDFTAIASAQQHDDELIQLRKSSSLKLTDVPLPQRRAPLPVMSLLAQPDLTFRNNFDEQSSILFTHFRTLASMLPND